MLTSSNANSWTLQKTDTKHTLHYIAYGKNTFVAIGNAGTILTSKNVHHWTIRHTDNTQYFTGLIYADNKFIAVGGNGTILISREGKN